MRYKVTVAYDGTNYSGWQLQRNKPSIQQTLNEALSNITNQDIKVAGCSRTDINVHALGQVFHFDTDREFKNLMWSINSQLPKDICVKQIEEVDEQFHARFSAMWKHYDYLINDGDYNPFLANYAMQLRRPIDENKLKEVANIFIGEHDFSTFNATKLTERKNQTCDIYDIVINREGNQIKISYYGNRFLRYMVRMLTRTMVEVAIGKVTVDDVKLMLEKKDKNCCHFNGEPQGLYLVEIGYQPYQKH